MIYEIIKIIIPAMITGFATYWVTKYNRYPTDKIEIAYNRIYYPLLKLIKKPEDIWEYKKITEEVQRRLRKYDKYASKTTIKACQVLEENINNKSVKYYFQLLVDDIYKYNSKFRRKLGYPEPYSIFIFKYLSVYNKAQVIMLFSAAISLICINLFGIFFMFTKITYVVLIILTASFVIFIISTSFLILYKFLPLLWRQICKLKSRIVKE